MPIGYIALIYFLLFTYLLSIFPFILQIIFYIASTRRNTGTIDISMKAQSGENPPKVTILVPVRNEDPHLVIRLLYEINKLNYDHDKIEVIIISDDLKKDFLELKNIIENTSKHIDYEVKLLWRPYAKGFKAGALNYGLKHAKGEIITVLDADSLPEQNLLKKALYTLRKGYDALMVKWLPSNPNENLLCEAIGSYQKFAFKTLFEGRFKVLGYTGLAGSGFIIRREVLEKLGGFNENCILEDVDLGLRLFLKKYNIGFLTNTHVSLEVPSDYLSYREQQKRWAYGAAQIMKKYCISILKSARSIIEKLEYSVYLSQYISSLLLLLFTLLATLLYLAYGSIDFIFKPLLTLWVFVFSIYTGLFIHFNVRDGLSIFRAIRIAGRISGVTYPMIPHLMLSTFKALIGIRLFWLVTPKGARKREFKVRERFPLIYETLYFTLLALLLFSVLSKGYLLISSWILLQLSSAPYFYYMFLKEKI